MSDPVGKFIAVVSLHFPLPKFQSEDVESAWLASMIKFLGGYSDEVLSRTAEYIIQTRDPKKDGKFFPVPAEIIRHADSLKVVIAAEKNQAPPLLSHGQKDQSPYAGWRSEEADRLIQTEMGRQAAKEGWIGSLWHWCRKKLSLPRTSAEVREIKSDAQVFNEALAKVEAGEGGVCNAALLKLGRTMQERRTEMAKSTEGSR